MSIASKIRSAASRFEKLLRETSQDVSGRVSDVGGRLEDYIGSTAQRNIQNYQKAGSFLDKYSPQGITANLVKEIPRSTARMTASGLISIPGRNRQDELTPETTAEKMVFGTDPIPSIQRGWTSTYLQKKGVDPKLANIAGAGVVVGSLGLDVTGAGGVEKNIAKATTKAGVVKALGKAAKNYSDDILETLAKTKDTKVIGQIVKNSKNIIKIADDDKRFMADFIDKVRLGSGVSQSEANQADAILQGHKIKPTEESLAGVADSFDDILQRTAGYGREFLRNKQGNRYAGSKTVRKVVPDAMGGMAGMEQYKDEEGNIKYRFDPLKAGLGVAGMSVARRVGGKGLKDDVVKELG